MKGEAAKSWTASIAQRIGIGAPTLKTFLDGGRIYPKTRKSIEAYLD